MIRWLRKLFSKTETCPLCRGRRIGFREQICGLCEGSGQVPKRRLIEMANRLEVAKRKPVTYYHETGPDDDRYEDYK